jgi:hypothetical protein
MTKISEAQTYGLTIRESATDGSDFANAPTDYRRLFLGEDGALHLKDSAGTVTDVGTAGSSMATDALWDAAGDLAVGTGANTGGRLAAGAAGGVLAMGNSAVIWNAGTSFPASKATNDRYWRTDLGMEFYWDGTRWVSSTLYRGTVIGVPNPVTGASAAQGGFNTPEDIYVYTLYGLTYVATTNDGSNYWGVKLQKDSSTDVGSAFNTSADSANTATAHSAALNSAISGNKNLNLYFTKTGSPGDLYAGSGAFYFTYRLIGT